VGPCSARPRFPGGPRKERQRAAAAGRTRPEERTDLDKKARRSGEDEGGLRQAGPVAREDAKRQKRSKCKSLVDAQTAAGQMQEETLGRRRRRCKHLKRCFQGGGEVSDKENFTLRVEQVRAALRHRRVRPHQRSGPQSTKTSGSAPGQAATTPAEDAAGRKGGAPPKKLSFRSGTAPTRSPSGDRAPHRGGGAGGGPGGAPGKCRSGQLEDGGSLADRLLCQSDATARISSPPARGR